jgi:hypothetical protein
MLVALLLVSRDESLEQQVVQAHWALPVAGSAQLLGGQVGTNGRRGLERPVENFPYDGLPRDISQGVSGGNFVNGPEQLASLLGIQLVIVNTVENNTSTPGQSAKVPDKSREPSELWEGRTENPPDRFRDLRRGGYNRGVRCGDGFGGCGGLVGPPFS